MLLKKRDNLQTSLCDKLTLKAMEDETLTEEANVSCTVPTYVNIHT